MDLDSVADELYGLPPDAFTATRNARAKQARADGDRELAEAIRQLAKPTTSAWLVNRLARERDEELEPLIDLGRDLREATSRVSGEELRALTRQRHEVVQALVQQARRVGAAHGSRVSESVATEVRRTLDASLADPEVAEVVLSGRLTHAVEYAGFGQPSGTAWPGPRRGTTTEAADRPPKGSRRPEKGSGRKVADLAARRRDSARRALSEAEEALRAARSDHDAATSEEEEASGALETAKKTVEQVRADLEAAKEQSRSAGRAERAARERTKRTEHAVRKAEQAREEAAARLADLED